MVSSPPTFVKKILGGEVEFTSAQRTINGEDRVITRVWIDFDEPAMDVSGDGPYMG